MKVYKDYYDILGVSPQDSQERIKQVFRKKAQLYHPDQNPSDKFAEEMFKDISDAYDVLGDKDKREAYDRERRLNHHTSSTADPGASTTNNQSNAQSSNQTKTSGSSSTGSTPKHKPRKPNPQDQNHANSQSSQSSNSTIQSKSQAKAIRFFKMVLIIGLIPPCVILILAGILQLGHVIFGVDDPGITGSVNLVTNFFVAIACIAVGGLFAWLIAKLS